MRDNKGGKPFRAARDVTTDGAVPVSLSLGCLITYVFICLCIPPPPFCSRLLSVYYRLPLAHLAFSKSPFNTAPALSFPVCPPLRRRLDRKSL